jgi:hypothetical protein
MRQAATAPGTTLSSELPTREWPPLFVGVVSLTALLDVKPWDHTIPLCRKLKGLRSFFASRQRWHCRNLTAVVTRMSAYASPEALVGAKSAHNDSSRLVGGGYLSK